MTDKTKEAAEDALRDLESRERRNYLAYVEWVESLGIEPADLQRWRALRCRALNEYETERMELATYLVAMGAPLPALRPGSKPNIVSFVFPDEYSSTAWTAQEFDIVDPEGREVALVSGPKLFTAIVKIRKAVAEYKGLPFKAPKHKPEHVYSKY